MSGSIKGKVANNDAQVKDVTVTDDGTKTALDVNIVSDASAGSGPQDVIILNDIVPEVKDQITIVSKNVKGDPLVVEYRNEGALVATLNLSYDVDGDLQEVLRT